MRKFKADLHIHSCLSPCAELDMTPVAIVKRASEIGLDIIAVADHNTADHAEVTLRIAREYHIAALPAMEITTVEEAHILAVFDNTADCIEVQHAVHSSLSPVPSYRHDETSQPVVNEKNEILFFNRLPLINATSLSLSSLVDLIHENNGLAVASHIDRESFSVISQLGFIPDGLPLDAVEISFRITSEERTQSLLPANRYAVVSFSDSHHVKDIGRRITEFTLEEPTVEEISLCFRGRGQRNISILY